MENIKRIDRRLIHKGRILTMYADTIETKDGNIAVWDTLEHIGAACVVPILDNGNILMVRQFRNPLQKELLEIPAGGRDNKDEPTIECARRELEEETGYKSDNLNFLLRSASAAAYCSEILDVYIARDLYKGTQHFDRDEYLTVEEWNLDDLIDLIYKGEIIDSKTIAAIMAYKNLINKGE